MFKKANRSDQSSKYINQKKLKSIVYDEHFTRATDSVDLMKSTNFIDIGDGITRRKESEVDQMIK